MTKTIQHVIRAADTAIASAYLTLFNERPALMSFLFHSIFRDEEEIARNLVDPLDYTTVGKFRQFIEHYLENGYEFIGPDALLKGLPRDKKYALITFDDGYYNNTLVLPILEEFGVPALFFIATDNIRENKCFWWDVLYRERIAQGATAAELQDEALEFKSFRTHEIERRLIERFGPDALRPRTDVDRPFTPAELREFAQNPYVHLGNHTAGHGILTNYSPEEVRDQVLGAQASLREMVGIEPGAIAYPNGAHSDAIIDSCGELGMKLGFTVKPEKTSLPLAGDARSLLTLGRFCFHDSERIETQCRTYRSDVLVYGKFRSSYVRLRRGNVTR
jgi:peptidoglycan/xylan/chitin deacetylase (PgdA/CDA1 family)